MPAHNASGKVGGAQPPLTVHPAFPVIVSLWFAALFGIGSMIIPVQLYEAVLMATGITSIVEAANAPLGFTARSLIALTATAVGAGLGFFAARKLVGATRLSFAKPRSRGGRRPLNPMEELGESGIGDSTIAQDTSPIPPMSPAPPVPPVSIAAGGRRTLAMADESGGADGADEGESGEQRAEDAWDSGSEDSFLELGAEMESPYLLSRTAKAGTDRAPDEGEADRIGDWESDCAGDGSGDVQIHLHMLHDDADLRAAENPPPEPEHEPEQEPEPMAEPPELADLRDLSELPGQTAAQNVWDARAVADDPLRFSPPSMERERLDIGTDTDMAPISGQTFLNPNSPKLFDRADAPAASPATEYHEAEPPVPAGSANADEEAVSETRDPSSENSRQLAEEMPEDEMSSETEINTPQATAERPSESQGEPAEGLVQLVQKLGSTLEKHRSWSAELEAQKAAADAEMRAGTEPVFITPASDPEETGPQESGADAPSDASIPPPFDAAGADDAAEAMAAFFQKPAARQAEDSDAADDPVFAEPREMHASAEAEQNDEADNDETTEAQPLHPSFPATLAGKSFAPIQSIGPMMYEDGDDDEVDMESLAQTLQLPVSAPQHDMSAPPKRAVRPAFDIPPTNARKAEQPKAEPVFAAERKALGASDYDAISANNPFKANAQDFAQSNEPGQHPFAHSDDAPADTRLTTPGASARPKGVSATTYDDNERALRDALMNLQRMGK